MNAILSLNPLVSGFPVCRLTPATRALAQKYLAGGFRSRIRPCEVVFPETAPTTDPARQLQRRGRAAQALARYARLEIVPEELLAGAAPYLQARNHAVPGFLNCPSISHTTADFGNAIRLGLSGLEKEIRLAAEATEDSLCKAYAEGLLDGIDALRIWTRRYAGEYRRLAAEQPEHAAHFLTIAERLGRVPENPPQNFADALQSFWSFFEFERLCGNWPGLGRFDWILGPWLHRDLEKGVLTLDEARELVAHFWIKGTEWCYGLREGSPDRPDSGDAQSYQNIILGGTAPDGSQVENEVTFLVLDVIEELHISDYPVTVRLCELTSARLFRRIADVQLLGGGIVSVYNEPVVFGALRKFGCFADGDIVDFTNDGCWEIIIPGKTHFGYNPFDALQSFQKALFEDPPPDSFEELYRHWLTHLEEAIASIRKNIKAWFCESQPHASEDDRECTKGEVVLSLLYPRCRHELRDYLHFGTEYTVQAFHAGGLPDIANSFRAIQQFVFGPHPLFTLPRLVQILRDNWQGHEQERRQVLAQFVGYGNNDDAADAMMQRVFNDYTRIAGREKRVGEVLTPVGVSTFGREIAFAANRQATAFGRFAHEYLAPNLSPTPGTEREPVTAVLQSYCKMDFTRTPNGCPLDMRLAASLRKLPNTADILVRILHVFLEKGGIYLQIDVVDPAILLEAQQNPDRFPNLVVRISGWSARFASLSREWQDMIIRRTACGL